MKTFYFVYFLFKTLTESLFHYTKLYERKLYNMNMDYLNSIKLKVDKEELQKLYCEDFLNVPKCAEHFGVTCHAIDVLLKYYEITRDQHLVQSKVNKESKNRQFNEIKDRVDKDTLFEYYITQDNSYESCLEHFNVTGWTLDRLLRTYGIKKSKKVSAKRSVQTRIEKAGGRDEYIKQQTEKSNETKLKRYGSLDNFYKLRREKMEETNLKRYGHRYKRIADLAINHNEKYQLVWDNKEESVKYLSSFKDRPTIEQLTLELNCTVNNIHLWLERLGLSYMVKNTKSRVEQDIANFIKSLGFEVKTNYRKIIAPQEVDIFVPEKNVAVEFNGTYWHSVENGLDKTYHFNKSFKCEQAGVRLIHVYEYQWLNPVKREILKSILKNALGKNDNIIYARKCELRELTSKDVAEFSELNSLHGHRSASIYLGLFYKGELVQLMTFGKAFFSRDNTIDYECIRSITKINTTVVGGMNKLFSYFVNTYKPNKILYYVDYNTHNGNSMNKIGFKFISYSKIGLVNVSNCKEVTEKYGPVFNRKPQKHKEIQEYIKQGKILTIYDCGVKKYIWNSTDNN